MKIYEYRPGIKLPVGKCAVAIGLFDGFHTAHRHLFEKTKVLAKSRGISAGIFTFTSEGGIKSGAKRLYTTEEKLKIAERLSADFAVVADFSHLANVSAEDFVKNTLIGDLSAELCAVGFNFRFGKGAEGDADALQRYMNRWGKEALILEEYKSGDVTVSSSLIRELLTKGEMTGATKLLGSPYFLTGKVTHGDGRGKALGLPTVNTDIPESKIIPKFGVYRSCTLIMGKIINSVTNVGICPTFGNRAPHAETYLLGFDGDVYGENVEIFLLDYLREEKQFDDPNQLILQIKVDIKHTIDRNGELTWQELGLK